MATALSPNDIRDIRKRMHGGNTRQQIIKLFPLATPEELVVMEKAPAGVNSIDIFRVFVDAEDEALKIELGLQLANQP